MILVPKSQSTRRVYILRQKGNNATDVFQMFYINSVLKGVYQTLVRGIDYLLHYYILSNSGREHNVR